MFVRLIVGLALLVAIGGGGLYVLSQQKPAIGAGLKPIPVTKQAEQSFDDKIKAMEQAAAAAKASGKAQPVSQTFTEAELTSAANSYAAGAPAGLQTTDTQIHLSGGNVVATSNVNVAGLSVPVGIVATPTVQNGQVHMVVQQVQTGGFPLPDALNQQLQSQIGRSIDPSAFGIPMTLSNLQVQNGQLVVQGTAKP